MGLGSRHEILQRTKLSYSRALSRRTESHTTDKRNLGVTVTFLQTLRSVLLDLNSGSKGVVIH